MINLASRPPHRISLFPRIAPLFKSAFKHYLTIPMVLYAVGKAPFPGSINDSEVSSG
jgi:hypothetical protein